MSDKPETLADIAAEIRRGERMFWSLRDCAAYADRIEAAAERERDEDRQLAAIAESDEAFARCARCDRPERAHGNAAAMRDLLEKIRHEYGWGRIGCRTCVSSEADVERVSDLFEKQIDAALSAPARNCDRFATEDEAREAYWAYREPLEFNNKPFVAITEWLFATAEGCDHA